MSVHMRIRAYMEYRGIPIGDTAEKAGLLPRTLQAILDGKKTLYADELRMICLALNVSPEAFIEEKKEDVSCQRTINPKASL